MEYLPAINTVLLVVLIGFLVLTIVRLHRDNLVDEMAEDIKTLVAQVGALERSVLNLKEAEKISAAEAKTTRPRAPRRTMRTPNG